MKHEDIIQFIELHFRNKKKLLIPIIDDFLENSTFSQDFDVLFEAQVPAPRRYDCYNSEKKRRKVSELGDISDIWTFVLTKDIETIYPNFNEKGWWCEDDFLDTGKEIHFCTVWINWFLKVYYIEAHYQVKDITKNIEQYGNLILENSYEKELFYKIITCLQNLEYVGLEKEYLMQVVKGIETDCSRKNETAIFDCLFSDIRYPTRHKRIFRNPFTILDTTFFVKDWLDINRNLVKREMSIREGTFTSAGIMFNAENKVISVEKPYLSKW